MRLSLAGSEVWKCLADELKAILWQDGILDQVTALIHEGQQSIEEELSHILKKHAALASGTQQLADFAKPF